MSDPYVIGLTVAGWLATTWLAYRWGLHSQKLQRDAASKEAVQSRRRTFSGFLEQWKAEISSPLRGPDTCRVEFDKAISAYDSKVPAFREMVALVRDDFSSDTEKFDVLTNRLGSLKPDDW
jgi:hypothetical protein